MGILLLAAVTCMTLWLAVAIARGWISFRWLLLPAVLAGVTIVIGSIFGRQFLAINFGPLPLSLDRLLWLEMIAQFVLLVAMRRIRFAPLNQIDVLVGALALLLAISTFSHDFAYRDNLPLARLLFFNFMPMGIYLIARHAPIDERQLTWIWYGSIAFGIYLSATAIAEWKNWPQLVFPRYIMDSNYSEFLGRGRGPFLNPVACGIFQSLGLISAIALWPRVGMRGRLVIAAILPLFALGIFATSTRSVWLSLALAVSRAVWLPATRRQRGALVMCGATAAALFVALFSDNIQAFKRDRYVTQAEMAESAQLRPLLAEVALAMARDRPLFGHGFGQYPRASRLYHQQVSNSPLTKVLPYMQHNIVLSYLTETGTVGALLLLAIFGQFLYVSTRVYFRGPHGSAGQAIGLLGLVTVILCFVNGMFHDVSIVPMVGSLFYFMLGLTNQLYSAGIRLGSPEKSANCQETPQSLPQRMAS